MTEWLIFVIVLLIASIFINMELYKNTKIHYGNYLEVKGHNVGLSQELISVTKAHASCRTALGKAMQEELERRKVKNPVSQKAIKKVTKKVTKKEVKK